MLNLFSSLVSNDLHKGTPFNERKEEEFKTLLPSVR